MIALLAAFVVSSPAELPPNAQLSPTARMRACGLMEAQPVRKSDSRARATPLDELPAAHQELAVLRIGPDGCSKAVIVRENVNGDGRFAKPRD